MEIKRDVVKSNMVIEVARSLRDAVDELSQCGGFLVEASRAKYLIDNEILIETNPNQLIADLIKIVSEANCINSLPINEWISMVIYTSESFDKFMNSDKDTYLKLCVKTKLIRIIKRYLNDPEMYETKGMSILENIESLTNKLVEMEELVSEIVRCNNKNGLGEL